MSYNQGQKNLHSAQVHVQAQEIRRWIKVALVDCEYWSAQNIHRQGIGSRSKFKWTNNLYNAQIHVQDSLLMKLEDAGNGSFQVLSPQNVHGQGHRIMVGG